MDESASMAPLESSNEAVRSSRITWLVMSVIATVALALVAAHAPARIRLLGLFFIVFGAIVGWGVTRLASVLDVRVSRWTRGSMAGVLTSLGLIGYTFETIRLERSAQSHLTVQERMQVELQNSGMPIVKDQATASQSKGPVQWSVPTQTTFSSYLARRTRPLGSWKSPGPELFWTCEVVLAVMASAWVAATSNRLSEPATSDEPVKT